MCAGAHTVSRFQITLAFAARCTKVLVVRVSSQYAGQVSQVVLCRAPKRPARPVNRGGGAMQTAHLTINGMSFDASARSVQSALSVIRGVSDVSVSVTEKEATIRYDPRKVLPRQFETAVRVVGCEVESLVVDTPEPS